MLINSAGGLGQAYNTENYALQRQNYQTTSHKSQIKNPESTVEISAEAKIKQVQEDSGLIHMDDMLSEDELKIFENISSSTGDVESTNFLKGLFAFEKILARKGGKIEPKLDTDYITNLIERKIKEGPNNIPGMDLNYLQSVSDYFKEYNA